MTLAGARRVQAGRLFCSIPVPAISPSGMQKPKWRKDERKDCPEWCTGKHAAGSPFHEGARNPITSPSGAQMWAHVVSFTNGPRISAAAYHGDTGATVIEGDAGNAAELANVLDVLAAASPQDIRAFAAQVREASAQAFHEPEAGA